jgi:transposase InsO family protein
MAVPQSPNERWSIDFVSDQFFDGRRLRILAVVDDCTRECLALVADTSISGLRVARELDRLLVARQADDNRQRQRPTSGNGAVGLATSLRSLTRVSGSPR